MKLDQPIEISSVPAHHEVFLDKHGIIIDSRLSGDYFGLDFGWPSDKTLKGKPVSAVHEHHAFLGVDFFLEVKKVIARIVPFFECRFEYQNGSRYQIYAMKVFQHNHGLAAVRVEYSLLPIELLERDQLIRKTQLSHSLISHIPMGCIFQDRHFRIRLANSAAEIMLGCTEQELTQVRKEGMPWQLLDHKGEVLPFDEHPGNYAVVRRKAKRNQILQLKIREPNFVRWVKASSEPIFDSVTGELLGAIVSFIDINEERLVKNALQTITERSQVAIESAEMGVWDWVPDQSLMIWDKKMFSLYGFENEMNVTPQEAFSTSVHPDDQTLVEREMRTLLRGKGGRQLDFRVVWPDGSIHFLRAQASAKKNAKGKVERIVGVSHDITSIVRSEEQLRDLAYRDDLTGVLSRVGLKKNLDVILAREKSQVGILLIGLDKFKDVNDHFGHPTGDALLKEVATRLKRVTSEHVMLSRIGGDEFVVVVEQLDEKLETRIQGLVAQIRSLLDTPFYIELGPVVSVNASIGVSCAPTDGENTTNLLRAADLAMNYAKGDGGDCVRYFTASMLETINRRYSLQRQLEEAVYAEEFELYYQPIVDMDDRRVIGCEALIRWWDKSGKFVPPDVFIPIIEESGLIYPLGKWICRTAIKQFKLWQNLKSDLEYVSINVSPLQLKQPAFLDEISEMITRYNISPESIQLEITEGTFLSESQSADSRLDILAKQGFRLAIDDFGTGYSSLAYLKRFNVDVIKVDRSFIMDIETDQSDKDIVGAIYAMNNKLGFKTLVEGIETDMQADIVKGIGCEACQGYLFGKPTFADEFAENYLSQSN